jgi:hypothetical protein
MMGNLYFQGENPVFGGGRVPLVYKGVQGFGLSSGVGE